MSMDRKSNVSRIPAKLKKNKDRRRPASASNGQDRERKYQPSRSRTKSVKESTPDIEAVLRQEQAELIESQQRLMATFERAPVGIVECSLEGKYINVNEEFCRISGYKKDELLRRGIKDLTQDEDYSIDIILHQRLVEDKIPSYQIEKRYVRKDGGIIWAELTRKVIRDSNGKALHTIGVVIDVSERKGAELEIQNLSRMPAENPNPVMRLTPDGKILYANAASAPLLESWKWQIDQTIPKELQKHLANVFASGLKKEIEIEQDGKTFLCTLAPIREGGYVNLYGNDITKRKRIEQELAGDRELLERLFETLPVMLTIYEPSTKVLRLNSQFERLIGWRSEEATGISLMEACYPDPDYREQVMQFMEACADEWMDIHMQTREGRTLETSWANIRLTNDMQVGIGIDITERKSAEEKLRESEERFRNLANAVPSIVWTASPDGKILYANDQWYNYTGISIEDNAKNWAELVLHPEDYERCMREWTHALETTPDEYRIEVRNRRYDGQYRWFQTRAVPVRDALGKVSAWYGVTTDIHDRIEAEKSLRASEEEKRRLNTELQAQLDELNSLLAILPTGVWVSNHDCSEITGNLAAYEMLGLPQGINVSITSPEPQLPIGLQLFVNGIEVSPEEAPIQQVASTGKPLYNLEHDLLFADGRRKSIQANIVPLFDQDGAVRKVIASYTDITERKKVEETLRASETLYRAIARSIPGGGIYVVDKDLRYLVAEGAVSEAFGLTREMLEGHTLSEVFDEEIAAKMEERFHRTFAGETVSYETRRDERVYWTQQALMDNPLGHAIAVTVDVTERKQIEEALRESEERFSAILRQATAGIVRKDTEGRFVYVNQAFCNMLGYTNAYLLGKTVWEFMHDDDVAENKRSFDRLMVGGIPFKLERRFIRRDGSVIWVDASVSPLMDAFGRPQSAVAVEVDITGRKQAEETLQLLNLQLENRVQSRTEKLNDAIRALREEINERTQVEEALRENRRRLQILSRRLVEVQEEERRAIARELHDRVGQTLAALNINLIIMSSQLSEDVLQTIGSRMDDSMQLVAEAVSLVRNVMTDLRPAVLDDYGLEAALQSYIDEYSSRYEIQVLFDHPDQDIPRLGSSLEMTLLRIAQEALTNVARHAQVDEVSVSLQLGDGAVHLVVQDNGVGIEASPERNHSDSHGLKIMRERAEAFGGTVNVESVPGKGTKVEARVPIEHDAQNKAPEER